MSKWKRKRNHKRVRACALDQRFDSNLIFEADQGERLPRRLGESLVAHAFQPEHGVLPVGPEAGAQLLKRVIEIENNRL